MFDDFVSAESADEIGTRLNRGKGTVYVSAGKSDCSIICIKCNLPFDHRQRPQSLPMQASVFHHRSMPEHEYDPMDEDEYDADSDTYSVLSDSFSTFSSRRSISTADTEMHSIRSASPTRSVMSMTSSIRATAYRHEYGRGLNNYSEVYSLPADEEELERLGIFTRRSTYTYSLKNIPDKQHIMFMEVMGKYVPPMYDVLADAPGEQKACVDLGCGSGSW